MLFGKLTTLIENRIMSIGVVITHTLSLESPFAELET